MTEMNFKKIGMASLLFLLAHPILGQVDNRVPSMNPKKTCSITPVPGMRQYRFLSNDDCSNIFTMPEEIGIQLIDYSILDDLSVCRAVKTATETINSMEKKVSELHEELYKIMKRDVSSTWSVQKKERDIAKKKEDIAFFDNAVSQKIKKRDLDYGNWRAVQFSIFNDNRILDQDFEAIAEKNYYPVVVKEEGKEAELLYKKPGVRRATLVDSHYSFFMRKASERESFASIIESNAPAKLHSESKRYGIAHVVGGDTLPASMTLNMPSICVGAFQKGNGGWDIRDDKKNPIFTVTRTFTVNQRAAYGYTSAMKIGGVVKRLTNHIETFGDNPFSIDDIFLEGIDSYLDSMIQFNWSANMGGEGESLSPQRVQEIKIELLAGHLKNYFEHLVEKKILKIAGIEAVDREEGAFYDQAQSGLNCYRSPLTKKCHAETYQLVDFVDAVSQDLTAKLTINQKFSKNVGLNQMEPFVHNSVFMPKFKAATN